MPVGKVHDQIANSVFGVIPSDLNKEMDSTAKNDGSLHRATSGHDEEEVRRITEKYQNKYTVSSKPLAYYLAKLHVTCDYCPLLLKQENELSTIPEKDKDVVAILKDRVYELKSDLYLKDNMIESLRIQLNELSQRYMKVLIKSTERLKRQNMEHEDKMIADLRREGVSLEEMPEALKKRLALFKSIEEALNLA